MTASQPAAEPQTRPLRVVRTALLVVILAVALITAGVLGQALGSPAPPEEGSADVGFARDMAVHHAQAVEMAESVRTRTDDPTIRTIATDVSLTQTAQIGIMQGWLGAWNLPVGSTAPRMAWMHDAEMGGMHGGSHDEAQSTVSTDGPMPGMATAADLTRLRTLSGTAMDRLFLQLMIAHHSGGVEMAEAGVRLATRSEVRTLAERVVTSQRAEITQMRSILAGMQQ